MVYDFDLGPVPASNVDYAKSLGFDGLVTRCSRASDIPKLADYAAYVATVDDFEVLAYVNYDFNHPESPQVWQDALPILAGLDAPLWVIVKNAPSMADVDSLLLDMARASELFNVPMVLYPHFDTDIEDADQAAMRMARVGHSNISLSLHTCHEIRAGNQYSLKSVATQHSHHSSIVTIAGADANAYAGPPQPGPHFWDDAIKPLDSGKFNLLPFLRGLNGVGYSGIVVLQTYGLGTNPGHLQRSLKGYEKYQAGL